MSFRRKGKIAFAHIEDQTGKIQIYVKQDEVGEEAFRLIKMLNVDDVIGVEGTLFITHTGELTLRGNIVTLLTKNIRALPEKFHGLTDVETRYRKRCRFNYESRRERNFLKRTMIIKELKNI